MTPRPPASQVELHVDALALHGFPPGDHRGTLEAVRQELERLVAEGGLPGVAQRDGARSLDAGSFVVSRDELGGQMPVQVARAVYGAIR